MTWDETLDFLAPCLPHSVDDHLRTLPAGSLREIRLRVNQEIQLCCADGTHTVPERIAASHLAQICEALTRHSLYARSEETSQGYVTLSGGHRMGLCGLVHMHQGQIQLQHITSACIRIAATHEGCASALYPMVQHGLLIIGPPGSGKTTLLRDLARHIAASHPTALLDERCELSACAEGVPQLDIGSADVLCGLPKAQATLWVTRSMAPEFIITDEIARSDEARSLLDAYACGTEILASVHGRSLNDAVRRSAVQPLMAARCFGCYVVLASDQPGHIIAIHDHSGNPLSLP